jgi:hypothetical protein
MTASSGERGISMARSIRARCPSSMMAQPRPVADEERATSSIGFCVRGQADARASALARRHALAAARATAPGARRGAADHRMDLVDDDRAHRAQHLAAACDVSSR